MTMHVTQLEIKSKDFYDIKVKIYNDFIEFWQKDRLININKEDIQHLAKILNNIDMLEDRDKKEELEQENDALYQKKIEMESLREQLNKDLENLSKKRYRSEAEARHYCYKVASKYNKELRDSLCSPEK